MLRTLLALLRLVGAPVPASQTETDAGGKWDPDG
jgi:hypothetical protein